jgi:hypothetical protein
MYLLERDVFNRLQNTQQQHELAHQQLEGALNPDTM